MLLKKYISELIKLNERNMSKLLKKPFDYDLLIASLSQNKLASLYKTFQEESLKDCFVSVTLNSGGYQKVSITNSDKKDDIYKKIRDHGKVTTLVLKKNKKTINKLKENPYNFNFKNCNLKDNKPILCITTQLGDSFQLAQYSFGSDEDKKKEKERVLNQLEHQKFTELDDWNWAAHDFHHGEVRIDTKGEEFIDVSRIAGKDSERLKSKYKPSLSGYDFMDKRQTTVITDEYWLKVIGLYFDKIEFTKGVDGIDIWPSIYSFCLTKMSSENDAEKMDIGSVVNEKGKRPLVVGEGERTNLRKFFKAAYKNVHNFSTLSRFSSEDPKNLIHKLQDGYIYICLF